MKLERLARICVFALAAFVCFYRLAATPLYETDEGFTANRAASFFRHQSWVFSYDDVGDDEPQFRKPPLLYWGVALLYRVMGRNLWAVRLPTAICAFLSLVLLYRIVRRYFDEWCALAASLLMCAVPFVVFHIRTAMLEMPLIFFFLAGTYAFLFLPDRWPRVVLAGLAGGGALLLKGPGGLAALGLPILFGLVHRRFRPRALLQALGIVLVAAIPVLLYFAAVPDEYRPRFIHAFTVKDAAERVRLLDRWFTRARVWYLPLFRSLRWLLPSAGLGLVLALFHTWRRPRIAEWMLFFLLTAAPIVYTVSGMVHPYSRYLLPIYPFLLSFAAFFLVEATGSRLAALALPPFAVLSLFVEDSPLRWTPVGASLITFLAIQARCFEHSAAGRRFVRLLFAASVVVPSVLSDRAYALHPHRYQGPRPEVIPLARKSAELVPEHERVILGSRFTCHGLLFYSGRAMDPWHEWLLSRVQPGEVRYGVFRANELAGLPMLRTTAVASSGRWMLLRIETLPGDRPWMGVVVTDDPPPVTRALDLLNVEAETFDRGVIIRRVPDCRPDPVPPAQLAFEDATGDVTGAFGGRDPAYVLAGGASLTVRLPPDTRCCGLDVTPVSKREELSGCRVEIADPDSGAWREVALVTAEFRPNYKVENGRVIGVYARALRVRFDPAEATRIRITRVSPGALRIGSVVVWRADGDT